MAAQLDVGAALTRLTTAVGERVLEVRAASRLSAIQLQVLHLAVDGASISALTRILGAPKSTMTSVIDQLEALELTERVTDVDDRRRQIIQSTAVGSARLRSFDTAIEAEIDHMLSGLSVERSKRLKALMAKLPGASVPIPLSDPK